jgi:hypothetical protein
MTIEADQKIIQRRASRQDKALAQPRRQRNFQHAAVPYVPRATEFSADPTFGDIDHLVDALKATPETRPIIKELIANTTVRSDDGRPRMAGDAVFAAIAYVASKETRMEVFWSESGSRRFWQAAGFEADHSGSRLEGAEFRPSYGTMYNRFTELEQEDMLLAVERAGDQMIQLAAKHDPEIGVNVVIDGTPFLSPSRLHHVCDDPESCKNAPGRPPKLLHSASPDTIREDHQEANEAPPESVAELRLARRRQRVLMIDDKGRAVRAIGAHFYASHDHDAGARTYKDKESWVGGKDMAVTDVKYGGTLANVHISAGDQEFRTYPALQRKLRNALDRDPETITGDKGFAVKSVFRRAALRGISAVMPFRSPHPSITDRAQLRTERYDEYGTPRCDHCGGPGYLDGPRLGLQLVRGVPVLRFRCLHAHTVECQTTVQSRRCDEAWQLLTGLSHLSERRAALMTASGNYERTFRQGRARYGQSGKEKYARLSRRGIRAQRLRAAIARLIEWFYICLRHGWIGNHRNRNDEHTLHTVGHGYRRYMRAVYRKKGLELPYGPAAVKLGLARPPDPPPWAPDDDVVPLDVVPF